MKTKMRALLVTEVVRDEVKKLIARAAEQPTPYDTVKALSEVYKKGTTTNPLNRELFTIVIPQGYRVTYTHEYQREDVVCRHISVSADDAKPGTGPNPHAIIALLGLFGFIGTAESLPMWMTKGEFGETIIEALEPLDGDISRLAKPTDGATRLGDHKL